MRAVVVIPSVAERLSQREETVSQWQRIGIRPRIAMTPNDLPRSPATHGLVCRQAIRLAHGDHPREAILLCEDDVTISPLLDVALAYLLAESCASGAVITLYLPGRQFYPAHALRLIDSRSYPDLQRVLPLVPVRRLAHWFGSQCLILPPDVAGAMDDLRGPHGFDLLLRTWLMEHHRTLLTTVPNLAQHRAPVSVTSPRYKPHRSISYVD